jgi:hypothetical protein
VAGIGFAYVSQRDRVVEAKSQENTKVCSSGFFQYERLTFKGTCILYVLQLKNKLEGIENYLTSMRSPLQTNSEQVWLKK